MTPPLDTQLLLPPKQPRRVSPIWMLVAVGILWFAIGTFLARIPVERQKSSVQSAATDATVVTFTQPPPPPPPEPEPEPEPEAVPEPKPVAKKVEKVQEIAEKKPEPQPQTTEPEPKRRVFGTRKVYAVGFGAGGSSGGAVIGKKGNTTDGPVDTLSATEADLVGELAPVSQVTETARIARGVKPDYTDIMRENEVEGVVKVKILVDSDGSVKNIDFVNDLGFGTREAVRSAIYASQFEPARAGESTVAQWITVSFRFVLQDA